MIVYIDIAEPASDSKPSVAPSENIYVATMIDRGGGHWHTAGSPAQLASMIRTDHQFDEDPAWNAGILLNVIASLFHRCDDGSFYAVHPVIY